MSKKLTFKKGLAISAVLALGLTGLTAVPSVAGPQTYGTGATAGQVSLLPNTGTEWAVTSLDTFNVKSTFTSLAENANEDLKWLVEDATASSANALDVLPNTYGILSTAGNDVTYTDAGAGLMDSVTITTASEHRFRALDKIFITGGGTANGVNLDGNKTVASVGSGTTFTINVGIDALSATTAQDQDLTITLETRATSLAGNDIVVANGTDVASITLASGEGALFAVGDFVSFEGLEGALTVAAVATPYNFHGAYRILSVTGDVLTIQARQTGSGAAASDQDFEVVRINNAAYKADGSGFVYDSRQDDNTSSENMVLDADLDATRVVNVTAFIDATVNAGNLNTIQTTEYASTTETVTFIDRADIVATPTFAAPVLDATSLTATFTTVPVLNGEQVADGNKPRAVFTRQGSAENLFAAGTAGSWNNTTKVWTSTLALSEFITTPAGITTVTPGTYTARIFIEASATAGAGQDLVAANDFPLSAAITQVVGARVAADIRTAVAGTANTSPMSVVGGSNASTNVRTGTAAADVVVQVLDANGFAVAAGRPVVATLSNSTNYKVNTATTATVLTDASGRATFSVSKVAPATAGTVNLTVTAEGLTSKASTITLNWQLANYTLKDLNETVSTISGNRTVNKGGSYTFNLVASDQWKVNAGANVRLLVTNTGPTSSAGSTTYTSFPASVTIGHNGSTVLDPITSVMTLQNVVADSSYTLAGAYTITTDVKDQTDAIVMANAAAADLEERTAFLPLQDTVAADQRLTQAAPVLYFQYGTTTEAGGDAIADLDGVVRHSVTQVPRAFGVVTITGSADLLFRDGDVSRKGSITLIANNLGVWDVEVISNKAATASVVTVTSNGGTGTATVVFRPAMAQTGDNVTFTNPTSVRGGRALTMVATLADKWGNPVAVPAGVSDGQATYHKMAVGYTGGFFSPVAQVTNAAGQAGLTALVSNRDRGIASLTFYYVSGTGDATLATNKVVSGSAATWIGPIANAKAGAKNGRVIVETYRAKGKTVNVFVGSTRVATYVADAINDRFIVRGVRTGDRNIRVTLSGPGRDFRGAVTVK